MTDYTDSRIYCQIAHLQQLAKQGEKLSWHPPYHRGSLLSGKHKNTQRGRGMDFVELKHYQPGDDVRCIDWKVTQRMGQAFVREYALETDKNISFIIDQRSRLFFASDGTIKATLVAELAAIIAGRVKLDGDRFTGQLITDSGIQALLSGRGEKTMLMLLEQIKQVNHQLPSSEQQTEHNGLLAALTQLRQQSPKDQQIFILSDFLDTNNPDIKVMLGQLARHNSLIGLCVFDPLERRLPSQSLLLGNEQFQLSVAQGDSALRDKFHQAVEQQISELTQTFDELGLPLLFFSTHLDCWQQIQQISMLGR